MANSTDAAPRKCWSKSSANNHRRIISADDRMLSLISGLRHVDDYPPILDANRVGCLADSLIQAMLATGHIELPAMPRTCHDIASQCAFSEWSASMRADAIDHVKHTVHVVDSEDSSIGDDFCRLSRNNRRRIRQIQTCHITRLYFEGPLSSFLTCSAARRTRIIFPPKILWMDARSYPRLSNS